MEAICYYSFLEYLQIPLDSSERTGSLTASTNMLSSAFQVGDPWLVHSNRQGSPNLISEPAQRSETWNKSY
jgi:hypothetical protein